MTRPIRSLLQSAGLDGLRYGRQSQLSLLYLYNLESCYGIWLDEFTEIPDKECEKYRGRRIQSILSIHLDESSLNLRSIIRDDGVFYFEPDSIQLLWIDKDVRQDNETYRDWLEQKLRDFLHYHKVSFDLLLLSGSQVTAPDFQQVIRDKMKDNNKIVSRDYLRGANDHVFAAARGAARLARIGICGGFAGCVQNSWCPISEPCKKWVSFFDDGEPKKTEL